MRRVVATMFLAGLLACVCWAPALAAKPRKAPASRPDDSRQAEALGPERVGLGEPFVMRVRSRRPLENLSGEWLERRLNLSARKLPGGWEAVAVLGTDVGNTRPGRHVLVLRYGPRGRQTTLRRSIEVQAVQRPVERLTLDAAMVNPPAEAYPRIQEERRLLQGLLNGTLARPASERLWTLPLARPVSGEVSSEYGIGRILNGQPHAPHRGLDLRAEMGDPVSAAADGVVLFSGELYYAGNAVYLDHGQGLATMYFHLSERRVAAGERVAKGQVLGLAGDTGRSTKAHLHFGVWAWGRNVDPEPLFLYEVVP